MFKQLLVAIALSIVMIGCSERYGGPIYPVPHIPSERPSVPSDSNVVADIQEQFGEQVSTEIVSTVHSIESHVFVVIVENGTEQPSCFKITYYLIDGQWVSIPEQIEM